MTDDENFIVEGIELAKRIIKALKGLDAEIKTWSTLQKSEVAHPEKPPRQPDMKDITPPKKVLDVEYRHIESPDPQRDPSRQKDPPK